jgi:hypothetical protein
MGGSPAGGALGAARPTLPNLLVSTLRMVIATSIIANGSANVNYYYSMEIMPIDWTLTCGTISL